MLRNFLAGYAEASSQHTRLGHHHPYPERRKAVPLIEEVKATVVLEFDISTTVSNASTLVKVERILNPVVTYKDEYGQDVPIRVRSVRLKSLLVEPKHG